MRKFLSVMLAIVFACSCLCLVTGAEDATVETLSPETTAEQITEPTGYIQITTEGEATESTAAETTAETLATTRTSAAAPTASQYQQAVTQYQYTGYDNDDDDYTGSLTKTTRATAPTTAAPTTVAKIINDFGQTYRPLKIVALVLMILSAAALVIVNVRYRMLHPKAKTAAGAKRRRASKPKESGRRTGGSDRDK